MCPIFSTRPEEIFDGSKTDPPLAKLATLNYLGAQFIMFAKKQPFPDSNLPPRTHQALPLIRVLL